MMGRRVMRMMKITRMRMWMMTTPTTSPLALAPRTNGSEADLLGRGRGRGEEWRRLVSVCSQSVNFFR
jgi:hypothetical protein